MSVQPVSDVLPLCLLAGTRRVREAAVARIRQLVPRPVPDPGIVLSHQVFKDANLADVLIAEAVKAPTWKKHKS